MEVNNDFFDINELSDYLKVSRQTLAQYRMKGIGPRFFKYGNLVRYKRSWVDEWIESNVFQNTSQYDLKMGVAV